MLRHIHLLILDLDYLVFDCARLKVQALRQSLISLAETIPQSVRLPDMVDAEEGFRDHGFRWTRFLEIGLDETNLDHLQQAYALNERRLAAAGAGSIFPGVAEFVAHCTGEEIAVALGADASREYLVSVIDRHQIDSLFGLTLCTEEFGAGSADEMLDAILHYSEVNPSEALLLATRPQFFHSARNLDIPTIGCGWGVRGHDGLAEADMQVLTLDQLYPAMQQADALASRRA